MVGRVLGVGGTCEVDLFGLFVSLLCFISEEMRSDVIFEKRSLRDVEGILFGLEKGWRSEKWWR